MLWLLATLTVSVGAGALVGPSNIGKWCAVSISSTLGCAASLTAVTRPVYTPKSRGTGRSHGSVGRAE
jgi:hypothetical protein